MSTPLSITSEIQKLEPSAVIELFVLDATSIGGAITRFHAGTNGLTANIVWQGNTYQRFAIQASGFEINGQGSLPRPRLKVSNFLSAISLLLLEYKDLIGAKVLRKRTLKKYLDSDNFLDPNPSADPGAEFPDDVFYIDRKVLENRDIVEFELASSLDLAGVQLPRRQIIQNICTWAYRGSECGYSGGPLWDAQNVQISTATTAEGSALLSAYNTLLTRTAELNAANAAVASTSLTKIETCETKLLETAFSYPDAPFTVGVGFNGGNVSVVYWAGSVVTLGSTYRLGNLKTQNGNFFGSQADLYEIQRWGFDSTACTNATTAFNTAVTNQATAQGNYDTALAAYEAALAALPVDDPLYTTDKCSKTVTGCKLRFGATGELPFGGFPGAGLVR